MKVFEQINHHQGDSFVPEPRSGVSL